MLKDALAVKLFLDEKVEKYNNIEFIANDPIAVPHSFTQKEDIEIAGLFAATFAWGNRKAIQKSAFYLMQLMDNAPFAFIQKATQKDLKVIEKFTHRTFNAVDCVAFILALREIYTQYKGLEVVFSVPSQENTVYSGLNNFRQVMLLCSMPFRTQKHIADVTKGSAAKRLNMFLRWMVRKDDKGVDFGIWSKIQVSQLICPLDLHSGRTARKLGLLDRKQNDWKAAQTLTETLRTFCPDDPIKYDFALFGLSEEKFFKD